MIPIKPAGNNTNLYYTSFIIQFYDCCISFMFVKKNIWFIFNVLLLIGLIYLAMATYSTWLSIQHKTAEDLLYLNKIFSSSVTSTFDQKEIMLELLGQQLVDKKQYLYREDSTYILDKLLQQNTSLIGLALSDLNGNLIASSSNIDLDKMPNLKQSDNSQETFIRVLNSNQLVLGKTYFLEALNSWVIPLRKSIRNKENQLTGVMIAGIQPKYLLPRLNDMRIQNSVNKFQAMIIHDLSFNYAYISGIDNAENIKNILSNPVSKQLIEKHSQAIQQQLGLTLAQIKKQQQSVQYFAPGLNGEIKLYSITYLPAYQLWSITFIPESYLIDLLTESALKYIMTFIFVFSVIFFLFRFIHRFQQTNRKQILDQANHDFLTGLSNRLYLKYTEPKWIHKSAPPFSVFFIDLDNFKNINDSYGHSFGDLILKQVAQRLLSIFSDNSLVSRQGGDEFIILCKKTDEESLGHLAIELLTAISKPYNIDNYQFAIGSSIGICRYPDDGDSFDSLFSAADTAMYKAKSSRNNYFIFTNELKEERRRTSQIEQALHSALKKNEFHMVYQPQIASKGSLYGVEALIRWNNTELGFIPPNEFIPIAEDSGLILELGHFIINQSIKDIASLSNSNDFYDLQLSINISVRQFLEHGFLEHLKSALLIHKFPSRQLTLEITESIFIHDFEYMLPLFNEIRALGIRFSLDDFGTGYSSLSMLRKLPIDELKIDKSFVNFCTSNRLDKAMVINILNIAKNLGLKVVAEGIEQPQQAKLLTEIDCDIQQGYLYSRPIAFNELENLCSNYHPATQNISTSYSSS